MADKSDAKNSGVGPVRDGHHFDERRLTRWMADNVPGFEGPLRAEQFSGGQSNPTYRLSTAAKDYVLRRKPSGTLLKGAHAIEREARILPALESTGFPVPHVHALCTDDAVIGTWFYIMDMVDGRVFWDAALPQIPEADRPAYFDAMNSTIAQLHQVDFLSLGLGDYGRQGQYVTRQIRRWSEQYLADTEAGRDPFMDRLIEWLPANLPRTEETSIVHGDFRLDNMIFHPTVPKVIAVLDWELSTLGDPLADFSYHAMMYSMPPHIVAGLGGSDPRSLNLPTEEEYVAAYCRRTGRNSIPSYRFYIAFNFFRLAAIMHGIKGRAMRGTASSAEAAQRGDTFPELARIGWNQAGLS